MGVEGGLAKHQTFYVIFSVKSSLNRFIFFCYFVKMLNSIVTKTEQIAVQEKLPKDSGVAGGATYDSIVTKLLSKREVYPLL